MHVCPALNHQGGFVKCDRVEKVRFGDKTHWAPIQLKDLGKVT